MFCFVSQRKKERKTKGKRWEVLKVLDAVQ